MATLLETQLAQASMEAPGEHDDWRQWFDRYGPRLLLCARLWTRTAAAAEDVVQEAFVRFWRHQRSLGGDPLPLLLTSVRRAAIDEGRRQSRRAVRETSAAADGQEEAPLFEPDERSAAIEAALPALPPAQREVLVLKVWGELTFDEIARQLSIPPDTAASRYRYAVAALRKRVTATCHE